MLWEPYALAIVLGLVISAGLYFAILWPHVAPDDEADARAAQPPVPPSVPAPATIDGTS